MTSSILWLILAILVGTSFQECLNGGSVNGTGCICQSFFSGEDCSTFECINGGYLDSTNTSCVCPPGYRGLHCETVKASLAPSGSFSSSTSKSLNVINFNLHTFYWGERTYSNIQSAFGDFARDNSAELDSISLLETSGSPSLDPLNQIDFSNLKYQFSPSVSPSEFKLADHVDTGLYWSYELDVYENIIQVIKGASLSNSAITIITQHLPSENEKELAQKMILAFGIRINVLWISDKTYNNCTDSQIADFQSFSESTGGLFVQLKAEQNDTTTYTLVRTLLQTHLNPQYLQMQDIGSCEKAVTVNFINDPSNTQSVYVVLRGDNVKTDALSLRGCGTSYATSYDSKLTVFTFYNPQCSNFTITSDNACSVIVFTNYPKTNPSNVRVFSNYIEDKTIDASRYAIIENVPFFAGIHVESISGVDAQINAINFASSTDILPLNVENRRISAFEWVSKEPVQCSSDSLQFLQLNITISATVTIIRNVRINCLAKIIPTTIAPSTTSATTVTSTIAADATTPGSSISSTEVSSTIQGTTSDSTTIPSTFSADATTPQSSISSTEVSSTIPSTTSDSTTVLSTIAADSTTNSVTTSALDICSTPQTTTTPSLFFAYSTELDIRVYGASKHYLLNSIPQSMTTGQKLSSVRLECTDSEIRSETSKTFFSVDLDQYSTNPTLRTDEPDASNVIEIVRQYLSENPIENSVIVALLTRLPRTSFTSDEYATLVNRNIKIFTILSIDDWSSQVKLGRTSSELNKISALTNSHFVIANASTLTEYSDYSKIVNKFMQFGYSKDLIYTRNIVQGSGTELGTFIVPTDASLTITLSFAVPNDQLPNVPSRLSIGLRNETGTMIVDLISAQNYTNSNFYTADIAVSSGLKKVIMLSTSPYETLLRIWIDKSVDQNAYYVDLNGVNASPSNRDGAALRFLTGNVEKCRKQTSIIINDCSGNNGTKFDSNQIANADNNGIYSFVPYFCDSVASSRCVTGAENKFDIQIITDGLSITRSFLCADSTVEIDSNCQSKDAYGNYQCSGVAPFKRGPTGKITDCSRHGTLFYNSSVNSDNYSSKYQCQCDSLSGFSGESCEIAECQKPNDDGLSIDNSYRTYSVVIGISGFSYELKAAAQQALPYFGLESSVSTIWKYQLFVQCSDGQLENLYSGSSFDTFTKTFKSPSLTIKCSQSTSNQIDLSTIYSNVVSGVGRNVRGAIVYYTNLPSSLNVSLPTFLTLAQTYQQQLFVVAADEDATAMTQLDASISQAAMSTGGFLIQTIIDPETGNLKLNNLKIISDVVSNSTSIGYIAQNSSAESGFDITLETKTSVAYMITWNRGGGVKRNNALLSMDDCVQVDDTMTLCRITGSVKNTITFANQVKNYSAIVYVINEVSPSVQVISTTSQDIADALSTEKSSTTILSIYVPDKSYKVVANDNLGGSARIAERTGCTFGYTSYSVFADNKYQQGLNFALISLQKSGGSKLTRYFPIITSPDITCQNGGTPNSVSGSCTCSPGYKGPDCSLVDCSSSLFSAKPNSWSDVCVCDSLYDDTCAMHFIKTRLVY